MTKTSPAKAPTAAKAAPAKAAAPTAKPIKVLVEAPTLRGSRAARWPLVAAAKTDAELRASLREAGFDYAGTVRWLTKAELVRIG